MTTAVSAASESTIIRRAATPYGTPLTGTGTWPDNRTFMGDPYDATASLVSIGARFSTTRPLTCSSAPTPNSILQVRKQ